MFNRNKYIIDIPDTAGDLFEMLSRYDINFFPS